MSVSYSALASKYQLLYDTMIVKPEKVKDVKSFAKKLSDNKARYEKIAASIKEKYPASKIKWQFIALVHYLECSLSFSRHLHNGDKLTARTVQVPKGRPLKGKPPFTFEESAIDALILQGLEKEEDWSIPSMLYKLEAYNGFGYTQYHNMNSPYLWSGSDKYSKGKYVKDGKFDPDAVSEQIGSALLLRELL